MDIIITYVDDSDPIWIDQYNKYSTFEKNALYDNHHTLQYNFRSIETYLPFIDKIHLVVQQESQIPKWLNRNHQKLRIHYHDEFIPKEFLPTYCSSVIENYFFRINDLFEEFIYINDDMYFGKQCTKTDFFVNGLPVDSDIETDQPYSYPALINHIKVSNHVTSLKNSIELLYKLTNVKKYYKNYHVVLPYLKSEIEKFYSLHETEIYNTFLNKSTFRNPLNFKLWNYRYINLYNNKYFKNNDLYEKESRCYTNLTVKTLEDLNYKFICINDTFPKAIRYIEKTKILLDKKFSNKSEFEL